ncbi:MAG: NADH-quinone oxidoreductase subunit NuoE [Candidatus Omnitrophica bacterium]|nr:NADH-quinone oxidoreductase subunit NuoE [Candidatus Omnitrophota bacterium]
MNLKKLNNILDGHKVDRTSLIPVLQEAQEAYGYLPPEVLKEVSLRLRVPLSQVYGVVTFYAQFRLSPRGKNLIKVCEGTACHVRGGAGIKKKIEGLLNIKDGETTPDYKFTLETVACVGSCAFSPVMVVNKQYYGKLTSNDVEDIRKRYK